MNHPVAFLSHWPDTISVLNEDNWRYKRKWSVKSFSNPSRTSNTTTIYNRVGQSPTSKWTKPRQAAFLRSCPSKQQPRQSRTKAAGVRMRSCGDARWNRAFPVWPASCRFRCVFGERSQRRLAVEGLWLSACSDLAGTAGCFCDAMVSVSFRVLLNPLTAGIMKGWRR